MLQNPHLSNPVVKADTFEFACDINFDPSRTDVGFDVKWLFDGKEFTKIPMTHLSGSQRHALLDQKYLAGHLGTMFDPQTLVVDSKSVPQEVQMILTIPIVCSQPNQSFCKLELYQDNNNHNTLTTTACTQVLSPSDWNPRTNEAITKFRVNATRDFRRRRSTIVINFKTIFTFDAPPIFNGYHIPFLAIHAKQDKAMCSCSSNMHCTTFDTNVTQRGTSYVYQKAGDFVMYQTVNRPLEVLIRVGVCQNSVCICGVAAREGNDHFSLTTCGGYSNQSIYSSEPRLIIPHKAISQGTVISQDQTGTKYLIDFPSGAQVKVTRVGESLDVTVAAPKDDFGATRGLCGIYDGNRDNDLTHPDGRVDVFPLNGAHPKTFAESWRIPTEDDIVPPQDPRYNNDIYFCNCDQRHGMVECTDTTSSPAITARCPSCSVTVNAVGRKKKAADTLDF
ncbi:uncharacterized protein LOC123554181 isoform X2 [Mercenaria mercenaria]|uniref:uncharacterized protein LOC123554181 isoform X2 n=1 Tax=Mercenaria mercenaria TaxID=6596 RepID=UPI00234F1946|nr:uncharacterized protein LOC123554181 isoform X2 [Mercenaria mercenaria]